MAGRAARWGVALALGGLWWWGMLRLVLAPDAGVLEGAVVTGGWGLSLLPVHCVPKARGEGRPGRAGGRGVAAVAFRAGRGGRPGEGRPGGRRQPVVRARPPWWSAAGAGPHWQTGHQ
nr:hypothetical protein [Streptomyces nodosus]